MIPPLEGPRQDCDTCAYEGAPSYSARCSACSPDGREMWEEALDEPAANALLEKHFAEAWGDEMDIGSLHPLRIENAELKRQLDRYTRMSESGESLGDCLDLREKLAACQAREAQYRHAIADWNNREGDWYVMLSDCLDMPPDDSALREALKAEKAPLIDFIKNCYRYDSHDDMWYFDERWQKSILAEE